MASLTAEVCRCDQPSAKVRWGTCLLLLGPLRDTGYGVPGALHTPPRQTAEPIRGVGPEEMPKSSPFPHLWTTLWATCRALSAEWRGGALATELAEQHADTKGNFPSVLRAGVGTGNWHKWFASVDHKLVDGTLYVIAPSEFHIRWLRTNYHVDIAEASRAIYGPGVMVKYVVSERPTVFKPEPTPPPPGSTSPAPQPEYRGCNLSDSKGFLDKYVFDTFVVGRSNQLALAAAKRVSEGPGLNYNPLFIYGSAGLGKTHLLHAIRHDIQTTQPEATVRYMTSENFFNDFVDGIRNKRMDSFKNRYRTIDVLLLDDIQFFEGKEQVLEELFHTFDSLYELGHQMVLSCDRPPKDLGIEERLRSRFQWGLLIDIGPPDLETRLAILRRNADLYAPVVVPDDVIDFIARHITNNVRELEGALTRITACAALTRQQITLGLAEAELRDLIPQQRATPTGPDILKLVATTYGLTLADIQGSSRTQPLATHRQIAMYLCRELTDLSLPKIGRLFGGRDHTTIIHGINKIKKLIGSDPEMARQVSHLSNNLWK